MKKTSPMEGVFGTAVPDIALGDEVEPLAIALVS
jgi:hypothetical protein